MPSWFNTNPPGNKASFTARMNWKTHEWGKSTFAGAYAKGGGFTQTAFAPTAREALIAPWRPRYAEGSSQHLTNLRRLQAARPKHKGINRAIGKAEKAAMQTSKGMLGTVLGAAAGAMTIGTALYEAYNTEGGTYEQAKAGISTIAGYTVGWGIGMKAGMGIGAAVGSIVPFVGTAIGAGIGALVGGFAGDHFTRAAIKGVTGVTDKMVESERRRRGLNWVGDKSAFQTQRAYTMRQQSLQAMNRGMMNSRSMLGREAMMVHQ